MNFRKCTHQPSSFTTSILLPPDGKTSAGYTSRGFISRAKVKAIKYSIVIVLGKYEKKACSWQLGLMLKLGISLHHQQIKYMRWFSEGLLLRPLTCLLTLTSALL